MANTFTRYWPWWVVLGWVAVYEAFAVWSPAPTLSELYWRAQDAWTPLAYVVVIGAVALVAHLVFKRWRKL